MLTVDRYFPLTYPPIQMKKGAALHVRLANSFPFERVALTLTNIPTSTRADQTQALASAIFPSLKGSNFVQWTTNTMRLHESMAVMGLDGGRNKVNDPISDFELDLQNLNESLFGLYAQVGEINMVVPANCNPSQKEPCVRDSNIPLDMPRPWVTDEFASWRSLIMCEIAGAHCDGPLDPKFIKLLTTVRTKLLTTVNADLSKLSQDCPNGESPTTSTLDTSVKCPSAKLSGRDSDLHILQAYQAELTSVSKDLTNLLQNLLTYSGPQIATEKVWTIKEHGSDPYFIPQPVYALTVVNQVVTTNVTSTQTQSKSITSITVFFDEARFEVSTGALFSTVPNRSFANQTKVDQVNGVPVPGNVYIAKTLTRPPIVPFVAANFRIGHDVTWLGKRRQAFYGTALVGFNPYVNLLEYGAGITYSWRSIMFSPLYHVAHDVRLTQGEYAGEVFCNQSGAVGTIPKCSGSPPAPSTAKYLTSAFGLGISIRPQSLFSSSK